MSDDDHTIGRGGQLMLGVAPDQRGLLPEADVKRLEEFGVAVRQRYGKNLIANHSHIDMNTEAALDGDPATLWVAPVGSHRAVLEVAFSEPVTFDHSLIMERLNNGQHIEHFRVEVWDGKSWKPAVEGNAIGHKRIDSFAPAMTTRIRLNILSSTAEAEIREFQVYRVGSRSEDRVPAR